MVIANSLAPIPKLLAVGKRHYKRMAECKLGLIKLQQVLGLYNKEEPLKFNKLSHLQKNLGYDIEQMTKLINKHIKKGECNASDIEAELGGKLEELLNGIPNKEAVILNNSQYNIYEYLIITM